MKKFECPDLLFIVCQLASFEDYFDNTTENLASLCDWLENIEDESIQLIPIQIILKQIFSSMLEYQSKINSLRKEFPSMPITEWNKFNERYFKFIDQMDDLKLNEDDENE